MLIIIAVEKAQSGRMKKTERGPYVLLIILCFLAYTATYVGKYSYAANINYVIDSFAIGLKDAGLVETCLFVTYGAGQIVNGILCRHYDVKWSVFIGLAIIAVLNFIIPFVPFSFYALLFSIMGIGASLLWTSLVRLLSDNLPDSYLDGAILLMSAPMALGTVIIYGVGALFSNAGLDGYLFYFAGGLTAAIALLWLLSLPLTKARTASSSEGPLKQEKPSKSQSPWKAYAAFFLVIGLASIAINVVKDGTQTWASRILKDSYGFSNSISSLFTMVLPLAGVLGAFLGIAIHKKIKNLVALISLFLLGGALSLGLIYFLYADSSTLFIVSVGFLSCFMYAANNIVTNMIPLYLRDKFPSGLLAGLIDGLCYLGSAISSFGLGGIADAGGWNSAFLTLWITLLIVLSASGAYLLWTSLFKKRRKDGSASHDGESQLPKE